MNEQFRRYHLTYIERDLGLTGEAAEALLPDRARAARYAAQFTKERQKAGIKTVSWENFEQAPQ